MLVEQITGFSQVFGSYQRLLNQLGGDQPIDPDVFREVIADKRTAVFGVFVKRELAGLVVLSWIPTAWGFKGLIEHLVVDELYRGHGFEWELVGRAIEMARVKGFYSVELTFRPSPEEANRRLVQLGFEPVATHVYRCEL